MQSCGVGPVGEGIGEVLSQKVAQVIRDALHGGDIHRFLTMSVKAIVTQSQRLLQPVVRSERRRQGVLLSFEDSPGEVAAQVKDTCSGTGTKFGR